MASRGLRRWWNSPEELEPELGVGGGGGQRGGGGSGGRGTGFHQGSGGRDP